MGHPDDTQRTILGTLGAGLAVTGPPLRALFGVALMAVALHKRR
jgi:hypothetical protein